MQGTDTVTGSRGHRLAARSFAAVAALVGAATAIAACGGGSSPGVAGIGGSRSAASPSATDSSAANGASGSSAGAGPGAGGSGNAFAIAGGDRQNALEFAACMRANGVPSFPDPNSEGVIQGTGIDPASPGFQSAQRQCAKFSPKGRAASPAQQAQAQAQALKFSACMRARGVTGFPDPQFSASGGGIRIQIHVGPGGSGLDPRSPIFQAAQKACGSFLPGRKPAPGVPPPAGGA